MAILHVRNVPDELYEQLRKRAEAERRSLSAEVVQLLQTAVQQSPEVEAELFDRINRRRSALERSYGRFPSSVPLLREDRDR